MPGYKAQTWAPGPCVLCNHCKAHVFFKKNYVWQGGNGVTMYTVTYRVLTVWTRHHFGPVRRHWFLVNVDSPWEMKHNVRISRKRLQLLLDRITLGFSLLIPFKDFKCYGERGLPISSYGGDWRIFGGLKFSIPGFFWLVFHLRGDFWHIPNTLKLSFSCYWWNRRSSWVSRLSLLFFFLGGGGVFFFVVRKVRDSVAWKLNRKQKKALKRGHPSPSPPLFSVWTSLQLSNGCNSYFANHKRKKTQQKKHHLGRL